MKTGLQKRRLWRFVLWTATVLSVAIVLGGVIVLQSPAFEDTKQDLAARAIAFSLDRPVTINGEVKISLAETVNVRISDVRIGNIAGPVDRGGRQWKKIEFSFSVWDLLSGNFEISGLVMSGAHFEFSDKTEEGIPSEGRPWRNVLARTPSQFLNARVSDNLEFRDIVVSLGNKERGWIFEFIVERFSSKETSDGRGIDLKLHSTLNDLPLSLSGRVQNPRSLLSEGSGGPFNLAATLSGLTVGISGKLDISNPVATIDAVAKIASNALADVFKVFRIGHDADGNGNFTARFSGPLDGLLLDQTDLQIRDRRGRNLTVKGRIKNLGTGAGVDLAFIADLQGDSQMRAQSAPVFEIGLSGVHGQISGTLDQLEVEELFVSTNAGSAALLNIGPVSLGRIVRDSEGKLSFLDVRILDGPKDNPTFDLSGSITDVLNMSGINFAGQFNIAISDFLTPNRGAQTDDLGRLRGQMAASDTGGVLRLREFSADATGTDLISMSVRKASSQDANIDYGTFKIDVDIPDFDAVAKRLGQSAGKGAVGFSGVLSLGEKGDAAIKGSVKIADTQLVLATRVATRNGAPFITVEVSSELLDLADIERGVEVYEVLSTTDAKAIEVNLDDKVVGNTLLELDVRVIKLRGVENSVSNLRAKGRYENGIANLDRLKLNFLEGAVEASARADTNQSPTELSVQGRVEKLDMGRFLTLLHVTPLVTGVLSTTFDLSAHTGSRAESVGSLNGTIKAEIWGGILGSRVIELGGLDVVRWLFSKSAITGEAVLVCAIATAEVVGGRAEVKPIVIETGNVQVIGSGFVDIPADSLDLSFQTRPKRRELVDVATAFDVKGKLTAPEVKVQSGTAVGRLFGEAVTVPLNVPGLILPDIFSGKKRQPCVVKEVH